MRLPCGVLDGRGGDEIEDALRYLALVEGVPCRLDSGYASLPLGGLFCATHDPQHLSVVGIADQVADLRDFAVRQVDLAGRRVKFRELSLAAHEAVPETLVQRVPVLRQIYGRREDFREALVPPARDGLGPRSHDRRHGNGQVPVPRYEVDIILLAPIDRERLRRPAQTAECVHLALLGGVDERRDLTPDAAALRFHQVYRDAHRSRRVDGVAAVLHDAKTGRRRQVVPRRYDALPSRYNRTSDEACQCISPFLVRLPSGLECGASGPCRRRAGSMRCEPCTCDHASPNSASQTWCVTSMLPLVRSPVSSSLTRSRMVLTVGLSPDGTNRFSSVSLPPALRRRRMSSPSSHAKARPSVPCISNSVARLKGMKTASAPLS